MRTGEKFPPRGRGWCSRYSPCFFCHHNLVWLELATQRLLATVETAIAARDGARLVDLLRQSWRSIAPGDWLLFPPCKRDHPNKEWLLNISQKITPQAVEKSIDHFNRGMSVLLPKLEQRRRRSEHVRLLQIFMRNHCSRRPTSVSRLWEKSPKPRMIIKEQPKGYGAGGQKHVWFQWENMWPTAKIEVVQGKKQAW